MLPNMTTLHLPCVFITPSLLSAATEQKPSMSVQPIAPAALEEGKVRRGGPLDQDITQHVPPGEAVLQTGVGAFITKGASTTVAEVPMGLEDADEMIVTPGGARHPSLVHHIAPGTTLDGTDMRLRQLHSDGHVLADFGMLERRPESKPLMPDNVNRIGRAAPMAMFAPKGALTNPAFGTGWITYASWTNTTGTPISSMSTSWRVPPGPIARTQPNGGTQIIFLFNGIQNSTMIYQPVLCWGANGTNTGEFWTVGSWYADGQGGPGFHSDFVPVNEGQVLTGVMTLTGQNGNLFSYNCQFEGIPNTALPISNVQELTYAVHTLECYRITSAMSYPPLYCTAMTDIAITTGSTSPNITWTTITGVADCGANTTVVSNSNPNGEVDLCYGNGAAPSTSVVSWGPNRLDVFGLGTNDALYHTYWDGSNWGPSNGYEFLGGIFLSAPIAISTGPGLLNIFGLGTDGVCYNKFWNGSSWYPAEQEYEGLGGVFDSALTAVARSGGIDLFGVGTDSNCYHKAWDDGQWIPSYQGWDNIGGLFSSQVVVVSFGANQYDVFGVSAQDGSCLHKGWDGTNWSPSGSDWESLGGVFNSPIAAVSWGPQRIDLFGLGQNNGCYHKWWDVNGGWGPSQTDWEYHGGTFTSPPTVVSCGVGLLDVFGIGADQAMYHQAWNGLSWVPSMTDFTSLGGTFNGAPAAVSWGQGRIDVFGIGPQNNLYTASSNNSGIDLGSGWQDLGGVFDPA